MQLQTAVDKCIINTRSDSVDVNDAVTRVLVQAAVLNNMTVSAATTLVADFVSAVTGGAAAIAAYFPGEFYLPQARPCP